VAIGKEEMQAFCLVLPQSLQKIRPTHTHDRHALPQQHPSGKHLRDAQLVENSFWQEALNLLPTGEVASFQLLQQAFQLMKYYHGPTQRKDGSLYYTHPLHVARKVMKYNPDPISWIGALLHDVVEDSYCSLEEIGLLFGVEVKDMVALVSSMRLSYKKYKLADKQTQAQKLLNCTNPVAQLIKLCDRWHNLETLSAMLPAKRRVKIEETETYFIPLAKKLGYDDIAKDLERLCRKHIPTSW